MKATQGRPEAWRSTANLSRTRDPNFILQPDSRTMCFWAWETYHRNRQHGCTQEVLRREQSFNFLPTLSSPGTLLLSLPLLVDDARQRSQKSPNSPKRGTQLPKSDSVAYPGWGSGSCLPQVQAIRGCIVCREFKNSHETEKLAILSNVNNKIFLLVGIDLFPQPTPLVYHWSSDI